MRIRSIAGAHTRSARRGFPHGSEKLKLDNKGGIVLREKHPANQTHTANGNRRYLALALALVMICSLMPFSVFALAAGSDNYLCGHVHDTAACGYSTADAGTPCDHVHDEHCGYVAESPCTDAHEHYGACRYIAPTNEIPCNQGCVDTDGDGATDHAEVCAYAPAAKGASCTYTHIHDENCGYVEGSKCTHHCGNETCSYAAPVEGTPCTHICHITAFYKEDHKTVWTSDQPIDTYEPAADATYNEICAALPDTLPGALACTNGVTDIPVRWSCDAYSTDADANLFRAELKNDDCDYTVTDNPATQNIDESELPDILVTFAAPVEVPAPVCLCDPAPAEGEAHEDTHCPFYVQPFGTLGYISAGDTPLYAEASAQSAVVAALAKNTAVTILSETEEWINISCMAGEAELTGYVSAALVLDAQINEVV